MVKKIWIGSIKFASIRRLLFRHDYEKQQKKERQKERGQRASVSFPALIPCKKRKIIFALNNFIESGDEALYKRFPTIMLISYNHANLF